MHTLRLVELCLKSFKICNILLTLLTILLLEKLSHLFYRIVLILDFPDCIPMMLFNMFLCHLYFL